MSVSCCVSLGYTTQLLRCTQNRNFAVLVGNCQCWRGASIPSMEHSCWTWRLEIIIVISIVVNTTLAVLQGSPRSLVFACTLFVIIMYAYKTYGTLCEESRATWESWKREGRSSPWFRRYCRAYRPPSVTMGAFFYADKSLTLTNLSIVLNNTASMILTAQEN